MNEPRSNQHDPARDTRRSAGEIIAPGVFVELVRNASTGATTFVLAEHGTIRLVDRYELSDETVLIPYKGSNNLIRHGVVVFPQRPEEYETVSTLLDEIREFIAAYVAISETFALVAGYYVLLSWIYDAYRELPYLRVRGDYGTGKTRFLQVIGSLCYKPIFASGASTVAPLFHTLDAFRGTLILDEGDFDRSDEKADIVKILNNGNAQGFPVLRMEGSREGYVNPRAFAVFGPKVIATRGDYTDPALESRFISEDMQPNATAGKRVPISLPEGHSRRALELRNKLLLFRLRMWGQWPLSDALAEPGIEPRINQVFSPLLALADGTEAARSIRGRMWELQGDIRNRRALESEAQVLEVIATLVQAGKYASLSIAAIAEEFNRRNVSEFTIPTSNKTIGFLIRRRLQLKTQKSHGVFVLPDSELRKLPALLERYGISEHATG